MATKSTAAERTRAAAEPGSLVLLCLAAWVVPGAGHLWMGRRQKGLVFLLALPLVLILRRAAVPEHGPFDRTQQHLALLTWVAFLLGTTGGLGTMFALVVSPDIRAWNRIAIYIALFGLTAIALLIDQLLRRIRANPALRRPRGRRLWSDTPLIRRPGEVFAVTLVVARWRRWL